MTIDVHIVGLVNAITCYIPEDGRDEMGVHVNVFGQWVHLLL